MSVALAIERYEDSEHFLSAARAWLAAAEVENNLLIGIALNWRGRPSGDERPYWASIHDGNRIVGCACRTPPHSLVLSRLPASVIEPLVADVGAACSSLTGVTGPVDEAEAFATGWTSRHGGNRTTRIRLKLHELTEVTYPLSTPPGGLRQAVDADAALARAWIDAYVSDTGIQAASEDAARRLIAHGQLFVWCEGESIRSMAAATRDTGTGCSINGVYTPPQYRSRGYATATVATLSATLLANGRRFCCLFTDAANPTSNSIYAKIGYRPIRDDVEIAFGDA